ncbi:MAG TPA: glycoside hydrolase family 27 protein [Solirubrobacteraceae bacterium]|nr:glycoside hydrolase family 27 protein [Solirubrobacteraceae bacterium]
MSMRSRLAAALALCAAFALALAPGSAVATPNLNWTVAAPADGTGHPTGVSCASEALCVAVDDAGNVLTTAEPTAAMPKWTSTPVDTGQALSAVSCIGSLCVVVDSKGNALASTKPTGGLSAWSSKPIEAGHELTGVSCPTASFCIAVDATGNALISTEPSHDSWRPTAVGIDAGEHLSGISCLSGGLCTAVDTAGGIVVSSEPAGAGGGWHRRLLDPALALTGISCDTGGSCVAVDSDGNALASGDPGSPAPTWSDSEIDPGGSFASVSCAALGQCVAVGGAGRALASEAPTLVPAVWSSASPDAEPLVAISCSAGSFCLALDTAGRSLSSALPPPLSLVAPPPTPRPSVLGTPALGSQLSCQSGLLADTALQVGYAWLRELEPIAGASASTYVVKSTDEGRHLQCRVTAANAAGSTSATSAFVNVPFQGLPLASGETYVGKAHASGDRAIVPVACSVKATHRCTVVLRLGLAGDAHAATIGSRRARLGRGARRSLAVGLNGHGIRLLRGRHRLSVNLLVSGTVIGSIEAPLSEQRLVLTSGRSRDGVASLVQAVARARTENASTPYMGWDTYFAFGSRFSESTVLEQASDLISLGLARRGYGLVWLDAGWWQGERGANGEIAIDREQWPHGIGWLARVLHHAGLRLGLYTDAGSDGCGGVGQGSYGHYRQDADTFAGWGIDAVKVDFCGGSSLGLDPAQAYRQFRAALDVSGRPMLLSICDFLQPGEHGEGQPGVSQSAFTSYAFGPEVGNSWRTDGDVGVPGRVPFGNVLRNLDADAAHPEAAGPGHWNDPDYLGPDQGMGAQQFRTQVSMWSMLAAPLMVSRDLGQLSHASLAAVSNREVIAIDQDPLGAQATLVFSQSAAQVWVKPLADGSRAVALLNRGPAALRIETSVAAIGMPGARRYMVRYLWAHRTSATRGSLGAEVGRDSTVLLRVSAAG